MTKDKVQKKILAIAEGMKPGDAPLTRADLAYELKNLGVEGDTPEIAKWVWESYTASGKNEKVRRAFVSNAGSRSLVDVYRMTFELESGNDEKALSLMADGANDAAMALAELKEDVRGALAKETTEAVSSLISLVSGTGGVESAKQEAGAVFDRYSRLVASYDQARERVQGVAADFVTVRGDIEKTYRRYVMALVDVFGDSVKTIAPEMFDFGSIKWLDVQGMLQKAELQYTTVSTRCSTLMGEISDSLRKRVSEASDAIRASGGGNAGLILAGLAMVSHYADDDGETDGEDDEEKSAGKCERRPIRATGLKPGEVTSRIASGSADATEKLAGLFTSWLELEALRAAEHKNKLAFAGELARIKKEFGKAFSAIDNKAEAHETRGRRPLRTSRQAFGGGDGQWTESLRKKWQGPFAARKAKDASRCWERFWPRAPASSRKARYRRPFNGASRAPLRFAASQRKATRSLNSALPSR